MNDTTTKNVNDEKYWEMRRQITQQQYSREELERYLAGNTLKEIEYGWKPADTAPFNESVLVFVPNCEHYGPGIYRAIRVNMGTGIHWRSTCWGMGRDFPSDCQPTVWMPLPPSPEETP
jgi:hypothetical protein